MVNAGRVDLGVAGDFRRPSPELGATTAFDFLTTMHQIGEKTARLLSDGSARAQAQIGRHFLARPAPDRFSSVAVRTVGGPVHQAQVQVGRGEISPDGVARFLTDRGLGSCPQSPSAVQRVAPVRHWRIAGSRQRWSACGGLPSSSITTTAPVSRHPPAADRVVADPVSSTG